MKLFFILCSMFMMFSAPVTFADGGSDARLIQLCESRGGTWDYDVRTCIMDGTDASTWNDVVSVYEQKTDKLAGGDRCEPYPECKVWKASYKICTKEPSRCVPPKMASLEYQEDFTQMLQGNPFRTPTKYCKSRGCGWAGGSFCSGGGSCGNYRIP